MYQRIVATAMNIYLLIGLRYIRIEGYMPLKLETVFFLLFEKLDYFLACFNKERACLLAT